jgi:hypothetical protein
MIRICIQIHADTCRCVQTRADMNSPKDIRAICTRYAHTYRYNTINCLKSDMHTKIPGSNVYVSERFLHVFAFYFVHICMYRVHICMHLCVWYAFLMMQLTNYEAENTYKYRQYIQIHTRYRNDTYKIQRRYITGYISMYCMYLYVLVCMQDVSCISICAVYVVHICMYRMYQSDICTYMHVTIRF